MSKELTIITISAIIIGAVCGYNHGFRNGVESVIEVQKVMQKSKNKNLFKGTES